MNKQELKELAATLNDIADGKAWELELVKDHWSAPSIYSDNDPVSYLSSGYKIRLKPWQLPQPPDGMQWHRDDWTEEMLPEGYRPLLKDEPKLPGDEIVPSPFAGKHTWVAYTAECPYVADDSVYWFIRTKRPLPQPQQPDPFAELKAAHAAGKKLQHRRPGESKWSDCSVTDTQQDPYCFVFESECYRIKPEQQKVPLGPQDVPPGTVFRFYGHNDDHHYSPTLVAGSKDGVYFMDTKHFRFDWSYLMENATINRSIPLTGKWNPEAWEPCYKLIDTP